MSLITKTIISRILGKEMNLSVYCPDAHEKESLPVLYFLHGRTGNDQLIEQLEMDKTADALIYHACDKLFHILELKGVEVQNHLFERHHNVEYIVANLETYLRYYGDCLDSD